MVGGLFLLRRILADIAASAEPGVVGALTQALTLWPPADPGPLGLDPGAATGVVPSVAVFGVTSARASVWLAMAETAQLPVGGLTAVLGGLHLGLLLRRQRRVCRI
ncbi:iron chelate uptake ABC transporter family permease subunit [Streptomyces sp. NPDC019531]|uniref:iron chelate uptake ABC transporter family permease subunit n=1 Tax=Streptomyces sp. NPDC019531 TaxID=3365062 RepID=UPI00384DF026